jgi:LysM repeat protein
LEAVDTPTSVPTPTAPLTPTASPTPVPEPTFHIVQAGDTLAGIADQYGVTLDELVFANGYITLEDFVLVIGAEVQIPLCEAHEIVSGNTLAAIAQMCGLTLDELVMANINEIASYGALEAVPLGTVLVIPPQDATAPAVDCSEEPAREQVIEYEPEPGEGIFCLAQKFAVTPSTILQANIDRLSGDNVYGEVSLLIAPQTAALITITAEDIENGVVIQDIADWYEVTPEFVTDWNGNPVTDPLKEGQQLMVIGADLIFGRFQSFAPETPTPEPTAEGTVEATATP